MRFSAYFSLLLVGCSCVSEDKPSDDSIKSCGPTDLALGDGAPWQWPPDGGRNDGGPPCTRPYSAYIATQIASGRAHTCALIDSGALACWGDNNEGQLGASAAASSLGGECDDRPAYPLVAQAKAVAAASDSTCAVLSDGLIQCWGAKSEGQLGSLCVSTPGAQSEPFRLDKTHVATAIAMGGNHTCAVLDDQSVRCWGRNDQGQLGLGDLTSRGDKVASTCASDAGAPLFDLPAVDLGQATVKSISLGNNFTCALLTSGDVKCWGDNGDGQLGLGDIRSRGGSKADMGDALPSVNLGTGRKATMIASAAYSTCAVLDDGSTKCWGYGSHGELGTGTSTSRIGGSPSDMGDALLPVSLGTTSRVSAVFAGASGANICVSIGLSYETKCWGEATALGLGGFANIGDGPQEMGTWLPSMNLGARISSISVGGQFMCGVLEGGRVKCWGKNSRGQLGLGDTVWRTTPDQMKALPYLDL